MLKGTTLPAVRVSEVLKSKAEKRAEQLGMNISDYIRYLIQKDSENIRRGNKMLEKLFKKKIISLEELETIKESEEVAAVENCGSSGKYPTCTWYNVRTVDGNEHSVYVDNQKKSE